jgi:serine/threonine protein kinase
MDPISVTSFLLGIPGFIDASISLAREIRTKVQTFKSASLQQELEQLRFDLLLTQVHDAALFVKDISPYLESELIAKFEKLILRLHASLVAFKDVLEDGLDKAGNIKRLVFTFKGKSALRGVTEEMKDWQSCFNTTLLYHALVGGKRANASPVGQRPRDLEVDERIEKLQALALASFSPRTASKKLLRGDGSQPSSITYQTLEHCNILHHLAGRELVERRSAGFGAHDELLRDMATILSSVDPDAMGILTCAGFYKSPPSLIFSIPSGYMNPRSLRHLLLQAAQDKGPKHPLEERFLLCKRIVRALYYIHASSLVHKSISPTNILLLEPIPPPPEASTPQQTPCQFPYTLGHAFLIGFDLTRSAAGSSRRVGDNSWDRRIYCQIDRQGKADQILPRKHNVLDDIFALGVVMLEIALWTSFVVEKPSKSKAGVELVPHPHLLQKAPVGESSSAAGSSASPSNIEHNLLSPEALRQELVKIARSQVPRVLGSDFTNLIIRCLTCKEKDGGLGDPEDFVDDNGVMVWKRYTKRVLEVVEGIRV